MSYSFGKKGSLSDVREYLRNNVTEYYHGARHAKVIVGAQLDILEAQGATHVDVSAFGHYDGTEHTIKVRRDTTAEAEYVEAEQARKFDTWLDQGKAAGHIIQGDDESPTKLLIPTRSSRSTRSSSPNGMAASPSPRS